MLKTPIYNTNIFSTLILQTLTFWSSKIDINGWLKDCKIHINGWLKDCKIHINCWLKDCKIDINGWLKDCKIQVCNE